MEGLEIRSSDIHGRGVFASRAFAAGDTVERCPVLVMPAAERHLLDDTHLFNYYFHWKGNAAAIALGYGSLYNHSALPCAHYRKIPDAEVVEFLALRDIEPGCEITVDYTYGGSNELWSRCRGPLPKTSLRAAWKTTWAAILQALTNLARDASWRSSNQLPVESGGGSPYDLARPRCPRLGHGQLQSVRGWQPDQLADLLRAGDGRAGAGDGREHVVQLIFDQPRASIDGTIGEGPGGDQLGNDQAELFSNPADGRGRGILARTGMGAAGVSPAVREGRLGPGPALQQPAPIGVDDLHGHRQMADPRCSMRIASRHRPAQGAVGLDADHERLRRRVARWQRTLGHRVGSSSR